jgi:hypothetical protein
MNRKIGLLILCCTFGAVTPVGRVHGSISVPWTGPNDGDNISITFAGFTADELTSITGGGYAHNHGALVTLFEIELRIDGIWQSIEVWSQDGFDHLLSERTSGGPIAFPSGVVDGIRLNDFPTVGNAYHEMYGGSLDPAPTVFTFDVAQAAVPEPAQFLIWATIIGLTICGTARRSRGSVLPPGDAPSCRCAAC